MDGAEIVSYDGPNAFNDEQGPDSSIGIYKWNWPTNVDLCIAYYDDIRVSNAGTGGPVLGFAGAVVLVGSRVGIGFVARRFREGSARLKR